MCVAKDPCPNCQQSGNCEEVAVGEARLEGEGRDQRVVGPKAICRPTRSEHCSASGVCKSLGFCELASVKGGGPSCSAMSDSHCKKSDNCKKLGACKLGGKSNPGNCEAGNDADCRASSVCKEHGRCFSSLGSNALCIAKNKADCAGSEACSSEGACSLYEALSSCVAGSDADCRRSTACKTEGRCKRLATGACIKG